RVHPMRGAPPGPARGQGDAPLGGSGSGRLPRNGVDHPGVVDLDLVAVVVAVGGVIELVDVDAISHLDLDPIADMQLRELRERLAVSGPVRGQADVTEFARVGGVRVVARAVREMFRLDTLDDDLLVVVTETWNAQDAIGLAFGDLVRA